MTVVRGAFTARRGRSLAPGRISRPRRVPPAAWAVVCCAALVAGGVYAVYAPAIFYDGLLLTPSLVNARAVFGGSRI